MSKCHESAQKQTNQENDDHSCSHCDIVPKANLVFLYATFQADFGKTSLLKSIQKNWGLNPWGGGVHGFFKPLLLKKQSLDTISKVWKPSVSIFSHLGKFLL